MAQALRGLSDDWTILHSVSWQGPRGNRQSDGEADFVLIHPKHGLIVVEVKGGGVEVVGGRWSTLDRQGRRHAIKDPFQQATESKHRLVRWLAERLRFHVPAMHCVVLPDIHRKPLLGPNAPQELVLMADDLADIDGAVASVIGHWKIKGTLGMARTDAVVEALAPTVSVRRTVADEAKDALAELLRLTDGQIAVLDAFRRNHRVTVLGGAGTGKTVLAAEKARQLAAEGNRTLLLCYNRLLAVLLNRDPTLIGVEVSTFHSYCEKAVREWEGRTIQRDDQWWETEAAIALVSAIEGNGPDAIVVDEAQDFAPDWLEALEAILAHGKASPFYVFADPNQTLWDRGWKLPFESPILELSTNCRNTRPIARSVSAVADLPVFDRSVAGPEPVWTEASSSSDGGATTADTVAMLIEDGFEPENIVVLCESAATAQRLRGRALPGTVFTSYGKSGVVVETIARFKGLEADAVVVVLDEPPDEAPDKTAYVAFSRARSYLHVIAPHRRRSHVRWSG